MRKVTPHVSLCTQAITSPPEDRMTGRRRPRLATLAAVAAATVALGCVSVSADRQGSDPGQAPAPAPAASGQGPDGTDTPEEFAADIETARTIAEDYWQARFDASGVTFRPISRLIPYRQNGEVDCGGQPLGLKNAAYCSAGD